MAALSPTIGASGKWGTVDGVMVCKNWSLNRWARRNTVNIHSGTSGATRRFLGNEDWQGSYKQDTTWPGYLLGSPLGKMPGEVIEFKGYATPLSEVPGSTGVVYNAMAMVESVVIDWDWGTNNSITSTTKIAGYGQAGQAGAPDGILRLITASPYVDTALLTDEQLWTPQGRFVEIGIYAGGVVGAYAAICTARASLQLKSANTPYVTSQTLAYVGRLKGNLDWVLSLTLNEANLAANFPGTPENLSPGKLVGVRLPIDPYTEYIHLWPGRITNQSNFTVDINTGKLIEYTLSIEMHAVPGKIIFASSEFWPATYVPI